MSHFVEGLLIGLSVDAVAVGAILALRRREPFAAQAQPRFLASVRARLARSFLAMARPLEEPPPPRTRLHGEPQ